MAIEKDDYPLTLNELAARLAELGFTGVGVGTLRKMARDGHLPVNTQGATRSTVNAFLAAKGKLATTGAEQS